MRTIPTGDHRRDLTAIFAGGSACGRPDAELVERFADRRDELAFAALVNRHGPMVLATCRRMLRDPDDADDAFQATFLVLVRRAGSIRVAASLGPWLHGVAVRVAIRARGRAARRRSREVTGVDLPERPTGGPVSDDLRAMIDEELRRLPARYRDAVVLCLLEGLTHDEAADRLGCPSGTVKSRLSRGRALLRGRLARRGLAPNEVATSSLETRTAVPAALLAAASRLPTLDLLAGSVPAGVALLGNGVIMTMTLSKMTAISATLIVAGSLAAGAASATLGAGNGPIAPQGRGAPGEGQAEPSSGTIDEESAQEERYRELLAEFEEKIVATDRAIREAEADEVQEARNDAYVSREQLKEDYAPRFLALAEEDAASTVGGEALYMTFQLKGHLPTVIARDGKPLEPESVSRYREPYELALRALELLRIHHVDRPEMANYLQQISQAPDPAVERLLREVIHRNPHREALGHAIQGLARLLDFRVRMAEGIRNGDAIGQYRNRIQIGGPEMAAWVESAKPDVLRQEIEYLHRRVLDEYADVPMSPRHAEEDGRVIGRASGDWLAQREVIAPGKVAPEIEGETMDGVFRRLSEYRGKVVVLSFWGGAHSVDVILRRNQDLADRMAGRPFAMLGVSMSYQRQDAERAMEAAGVTWPVWYDGDSRLGAIAARYHVQGFPLLVIDAEGVIRYKDIGGEELNRAVVALLDELEARGQAEAGGPTP